jgi:hypothetical protein
VHRGAAAVAMPWRNCGGSTRELARHPESGDFEWRLSVAEVAADGPFSAFPGVDRLLVLLAGAGMDLTLADGVVRLRPPHGAHTFAGEAEVHATLVDGPTTDLNLMVRRDRWSAVLERHTSPARVEGDLVIGYVAQGAATLASGEELGPGDAVERAGSLEWQGDATVLVFALRAVNRRA